MCFVVLGLDAEAMARLANLLSCSSSEATDQEGTTGSPNPELSLGFTNQEVCQSEKADIIVPNNDTVGYVYDFHKEMSDYLTNAINVATEINIEENGIRQQKEMNSELWSSKRNGREDRKSTRLNSSH